MFKPEIQIPGQPYATVLVVDDEVFNLEIITELLEDANYGVETAENGLQARDLLRKNPEKYHAVLLDRMMPEMDGIEVLVFMRNDPVLRRVPVIMQTAKATKKDIQEGLDAGVLYYITKPFSEGTLLSIVNSAVEVSRTCKNLGDTTSPQIKQPEGGQFVIRTFEEAYQLAAMLANTCPDPDAVVIGLAELLFNAVEHGNLGIGFDEKTELQKNGSWAADIERRLSLPENEHKKVMVSLETSDSEICFVIRDEGEGFDSDKYLSITPDRAACSHGRGIAMAGLISFDRVEFRDGGSTVHAIIELNKG